MCLLALFALLQWVGLTASAATFWHGPPVDFIKAPWANTADPANRDTITSGVSLTRGDYDYGPFNAASESYFYYYYSPANTQWATGSIADGVETLSFSDWYSWVWSLGGPLECVGTAAVLHLLNEDIYIDITITDWQDPDGGGGGGGALTRQDAEAVNAARGSSPAGVVTGITGSGDGGITGGARYGVNRQVGPAFEGGYGGGISWTRSGPTVEITLLGDNPMYVVEGTPFVDPGATAYDHGAGGPVPVTPSGSVNSAQQGAYVITYTATAGDGGVYTKTREVNVTGQPCLAVMPSFTQNTTYANAALGEPITVWGRIVNGMPGPVTYNLDFGDGTSSSGPVTDQSFIGEPHTYTTSGSKTMTLTVTDGAANVYSKSAVISVIVTPTHDQRINMAIEKGLLWLYQNQIAVDATRVRWTTGYSGDHEHAGIAGPVLCFEENGHLPGNDYCDDIYAETVQKGLNWLFTNPYAQTYPITDHNDGVAVQDSDADNDGLGSFITPLSYANGYAVLAVVLAQPNAAAAMSTIIPSGPFAGTSYYDFVVDAIDQFSYSQGDFGNRGGWVYYISTSDNGRYDGSAQQWPALVFRAALDRWGLASPAWMLDNAAYGYKVLQGASGGAGYSNQSWINHAKTGGLLVAYDNDGLAVGNPDVDAGLAFLGNTWYSTIDTGSGGDNGGWFGELYAMYGVKKGLQLQEVTQVSTPFGIRDWYLDFSAWLLGNSALLDPALGSGQRDINNYAFGQHPDGHWSSGLWPLYGDNTLVTVNAILVLTKAVTVDVPVAQIAPVGNQIPNSAFGVDGSASYHTDPANYQIVQYLWDWDASDGLDWVTPDATGPNAVNPGYPSTGTYTVTLRVVDNQSPSLFDQETILVTVVNEDLPPVAVAIPPARLPAYAGKPGEIIPLDGSSSFDPNGDAITLYEWDLDGDGQYDDATGVTTTFSSPVEYTGEIGLRVTANGKTSTNSAHIEIFASENNLYVESLTAICVTPDATARVRAVLRNHVDSDDAFNPVVVRFFNGNPFGAGTQIGVSYNVNLPVGGSSVIEVDLPISGVSSVYVYVDANFIIPEWNEIDNVASVDVSGFVRRPGDFDNDCCVSLSDYTVLVNAIKARTTDPQYDLNGDTRVNLLDIIRLKSLFTNPGGADCD